MKLPKVKFTAVGDMLIQRVISTEYEGFAAVRDYIKKGDARFFNFESIIYKEGLWGNQFNGGSHHMSDPKTLDIAAEYGFNMLSFANNHTFDWGYGGMINTLETLKKTDFVHTGVGMNLDEAAAPAYLDTPNGRVALISTTTSFCNLATMAGKQSRRTPGRPGINILRTPRYFEVTKEQLEVLHQIAEESGVNDDINISRGEGYVAQKEDLTSVELGYLAKFVVGEQTKYHITLSEADMKRIEQSIAQAKTQADYVLVSVHCHDNSGSSKENVPPFLQEFAHRCIDLGAHAIIGHGPHLLRPLEIYNGCPIFYSLGDFMLHNESVPLQPEDMYEKYGLTSDDPLNEVYRKRSRNYTVGLLTNPKMLEAVIPYFEMEDGKLTHLELLPIELGFEEPRYRNGNPCVCTDKGILERYAAMSAPFGTEITINEQGIGIVAVK
ncbi:MAG: CapA family protein [Clostridia bacterium]|nr:CapA family protein [Clostridia bacterium]